MIMAVFQNWPGTSPTEELSCQVPTVLLVQNADDVQPPRLVVNGQPHAPGFGVAAFFHMAADDDQTARLDGDQEGQAVEIRLIPSDDHLVQGEEVDVVQDSSRPATGFVDELGQEAGGPGRRPPPGNPASVGW